MHSISLPTICQAFVCHKKRLLWLTRQAGGDFMPAVHAEGSPMKEGAAAPKGPAEGMGSAGDLCKPLLKTGEGVMAAAPG